MRPERLDDDLAAAFEGIGEQRRRALAGADQHERDGVFLIGQCRRRAADEAAEVLDPIGDAAVVELRLVLGQVLQDLLSRQSSDALHRRQRQRERLLADVHDQRMGDRKRVRQTNQEPRALSRRRLDPHRATELLHLVVDDVHADAAPGRLCELAGRAEAGLQNQLHRLVVADLLPVGEQSLLQRLAPDRREIEPAAVVGDLDEHLAAFALDLERHAAQLGLTALFARSGRLDAVRDRVAQQVLERRQHAFEHLPVDLVVLSLDEELGGLPVSAARLTDDAREPRDVPLERHHPRLHQAVLQLGRHARLLSEQRLGLVREAAEQLVDACDVVRGLGERARELLNRRVAVELERIEAAVARDVVLVSMQDLRLGLGLELAQLIAQPRHR